MIDIERFEKPKILFVYSSKFEGKGVAIDRWSRTDSPV